MSCFFQAEDGIRDRNVTGVQSCALPICRNGNTRPLKVMQTMFVVDYDFEPTPAVRARLSQASVSAAGSYQTRTIGIDIPDAGDRQSVVQGKSEERGGRRLREREDRPGQR